MVPCLSPRVCPGNKTCFMAVGGGWAPRPIQPVQVQAFHPGSCQPFLCCPPLCQLRWTPPPRLGHIPQPKTASGSCGDPLASLVS